MTFQEFIEALCEDRKEPMAKMRETIIKNIPEGFSEVITPTMLCYVVPHSIYPAGYHCNPSQPLSFICVASQKNAIVLHHLGIYGDPSLYQWVVETYPQHSKNKIDIGKGCIRFKKTDQIPFDFIALLVSKIDGKEWIALYEKNIKGIKK